MPTILVGLKGEQRRRVNDEIAINFLGTDGARVLGTGQTSDIARRIYCDARSPGSDRASGGRISRGLGEYGVGRSDPQCSRVHYGRKLQPRQNANHRHKWILQRARFAAGGLPNDDLSAGICDARMDECWYCRRRRTRPEYRHASWKS